MEMDTRLREYVTLEEYVKMCEEAKEIQAIRKDRKLQFKGQEIWERGDYVANIKLKRIHIRGTHGKVSSKLCWLPTQSQLQAMVEIDMTGRRKEAIMNFMRKITMIGGLGHRIIIPKYQFATSWDQLWLAFVMKEKFNKVWDSENRKWRLDVH